MPRISKTLALNTLVFAVACLAALGGAELLLRRLYPLTVSAPSAEVRQVQAYLKLHPTLGFTWKEDLLFSDDIELQVSDTELDPLSTDDHGFINPPEAIAEAQTWKPLDVLGLGDSFVEHGSFVLHDLFREAGLTYYNMAIHRQCPPQYNIILRDYAMSRKPKWVVYGLFENDFEETTDYENWRLSGLDWFTYHSGTWCGRPVTAGAGERWARRFVPGYYAFSRRVVEKLKLDSPSIAGALAPDPTAVYHYVLDAQKLAADHSTRLLLLLIPSKETALSGASPISPVYDTLSKRLTGSGVVILDLRPVFAAEPDPAALYYKIDGHWNRNGVRVAGNAILKYIQSQPNTPL